MRPPTSSHTPVAGERSLSLLRGLLLRSSSSAGNLAALLASLREPDRDRLLPARYRAARTALQRATLLSAHRACDVLAGTLAVLGHGVLLAVDTPKTGAIVRFMPAARDSSRRCIGR